MKPQRWLIALALTCASTVLAQDADVEQRLREAIALRGRDDERALELFREIYADTNDPRALGQQALAEAHLGRHVDAVRNLRATLALEHEWVERTAEQLRVVLESSLGELATLNVSGPTGLAVRIVDEAATLPVVDRLVLPGTITIVATYADGTTHEQTIEVEAGETARVDVPVPGIRDDDDTPEEIEPPDEGRSIVGPAIGLSLGGAMAVGGVVMLAIGNAFINDVEGSERGTLWADVRDKGQRGETLTLVGFIGMGVGVALATASLLWLVMAGDDDERTERARWLGHFRF